MDAKREFSCELDIEAYLHNDYNYIDEWGVAILTSARSTDEEIGVEYNYCIDRTTEEELDCSGIYFFRGEETEVSDSVHYEIDLTDEHWKEKLELAMNEALDSFEEVYLEDEECEY